MTTWYSRIANAGAFWKSHNPLTPSGVSGIVLTGASSSQAATSSSVAISQRHSLVGLNSTQVATSGIGVVSQNQRLVGATSTQSQTSGVGSGSQVHNLAGSTSSQAAGSGTGAIDLEVLITLSGTTSTQNASSGNGIISQVHNVLCTESIQDALSTSRPVSQNQIILGNLDVQNNYSGAGNITYNILLSGMFDTQLNYSGSGKVNNDKFLTSSDTSQLNYSSTGYITRNFYNEFIAAATPYLKSDLDHQQLQDLYDLTEDAVMAYLPTVPEIISAIRTELSNEMIAIIELKRLNGLEMGTALIVNDNNNLRAAGPISQSIITEGGVTTVTRLT